MSPSKLHPCYLVNGYLQTGQRMVIHEHLGGMTGNCCCLLIQAKLKSREWHFSGH